MGKINVTETGGNDFAIIDAGTYVARCFKMVHIGTNDEEILGKKKTLNKVRIYWELPTEMEVFKEENGEQPRVMSKEFTLSLNEKANLRKFLEAWRGKSFNAKELEEFDLVKLIGAAGMLTVTHQTSKNNGKEYANITGLGKMVKGLKCPPQINESFDFGYDPFEPEKMEQLPEFITDKIKTSVEYNEAIGNLVLESGEGNIEAGDPGAGVDDKPIDSPGDENEEEDDPF